jgi:hypothetical protein
MSKDRKTKQYSIYDKSIIARLKQKHGFTSHFIYASLRGDRTSESSLKICEDYKNMEKEVTKMLNKL